MKTNYKIQYIKWVAGLVSVISVFCVFMYANKAIETFVARYVTDEKFRTLGLMFFLFGILFGVIVCVMGISETSKQIERGW
jgi:hypothetical protein